MGSTGSGANVFPSWAKPHDGVSSTLLNGLFGYWRAEDATGGVLTSDVNSANFDLTEQSAGTFILGKRGNGLVFGGTGGGCDFYRDSPTQPASTSTGDFTINYWLKTPTAAWWTTPAVTPFTYWRAGAFQKFGDIAISTAAAGRINARISNNTGSTSVTPNMALSLNTWYMLTGGVKGTTVWLVINADFGSKYAENASADPMNLFTPTSFPEVFGGGTSGTGAIADEFGFWDRELTSGEVAELYAAGAGKFYPF